MVTMQPSLANRHPNLAPNFSASNEINVESTHTPKTTDLPEKEAVEVPNAAVKEPNLVVGTTDEAGKADDSSRNC